MMDRHNHIPKGAFRNARPGDAVPNDYVSIPMYRTVDQMKDFADRLAAERAKDVTPRGEVKR